MKRIKIGDTAVIALLICGALAGLIFRAAAMPDAKAEIYLDGNIYEVVELSRERIVSIGEVKLTVEDGAIYFSDSDCHDRICVKAGKLSRPGDTAACLPNRIVVVVTGDMNNYKPDGEKPDGITG